MSDIPKAREILTDVVQDLRRVGLPETAGAVARAVALMTRASPVRRAARKHGPLSEPQRKAVRSFVAAHPDMHLDEVAQVFHVNPGRISEALRE